MEEETRQNVPKGAKGTMGENERPHNGNGHGQVMGEEEANCFLAFQEGGGHPRKMRRECQGRMEGEWHLFKSPLLSFNLDIFLCFIYEV
jgi:hypothetical protein